MSNRASLQEAAKVAFASLSGSKLRSFLTLLGIILATTTLIAVMSIIHGMDVYIAKQVSDMGADGFRVRRIVMMGKFDAKKYFEMEKKHPNMSREEYNFLRQKATMTREIGLEAFWGVKLKYQGRTLDWVDCQAVSANMGSIQNVQLTGGRYIAESDDMKNMPVAVIGNDVKEEFFPTVDPVGKHILVDGHSFEIIGVAQAKGSIFGESQDKFVTIPINTFYKMFGGNANSRKSLGYNASAIDQAHLAQAQDEVRMLLRSYRHLRPNQDDTFGMMASDSLSAMWDQLTGAIAGTAMAVVSVFLLVGGVVIMNIMLAVVTERTREIGIRKSVGARSSDILNQFLIESSMLSGMGGLIGVTIAYVIAGIVSVATPVPMVVPMSAILVGVGLSSVVGLFFGIYPARRAAKLDPIEALRYE